MQVINLRRFSYHPTGTLGVLTMPDPTIKPFTTIERPWMNNVRFQSCIPEGAYALEWKESPRFGMTYELSNVDARDHILIHAANFSTDVEGCIGIGSGLLKDRMGVALSRKALKRFHDATEGKQWILRIAFAKFAAIPNP